MSRVAKCALLLAACVLLEGVATSQGDLFAFMPEGGKSLLLELILGAETPADIMSPVTEKRSQPEWLQYLASNAQRLPAVSRFSDKQLKTLAAYLAINMPIVAPTLPGNADEAAWRKVLPADGRDLALKNCQQCHSIYSGYLTQARDVQGWRGTFDAPFHNGIQLSEKERETFASYSAINMPVPEESVPAALRY